MNDGLDEMDKMKMDQLCLEHHKENIQNFFETSHLIKSLLHDLETKEEEYKTKMSNISIPQMRTMHQEFEILYHQMNNINYRIKELTYQLHQHQLSSQKSQNHPFYQKVIEERKQAREILKPIWKFVMNSA